VALVDAPKCFLHHSGRFPHALSTVLHSLVSRALLFFGGGCWLVDLRAKLQKTGAKPKAPSKPAQNGVQHLRPRQTESDERVSHPATARTAASSSTLDTVEGCLQLWRL